MSGGFKDGNIFKQGYISQNVMGTATVKDRDRGRIGNFIEGLKRLFGSSKNIS